MKLLYTLMLFAHVMGTVIWVGGMVMLLATVRPAFDRLLEQPQRFGVANTVIERFFRWSDIAIVLILVSGLVMIFGAGGFRNAHVSIHLMLALGVVMIAIYLHARFAPFKRLRAAVAAGDWSAAARQVDQVRVLTLLNCSLGVVTIAVATVGRALL